MNLTLKPELAEFIQQEILTGKYTSPDEAIEAALNLLKSKSSTDRYEAWRSRLVSNPEILGGEVVFPNSRLSVQRIGGSLERGETLAVLREDYPYLTDEDFNFARI
jgi:uncharacterized protein (DUF433 family)